MSGCHPTDVYVIAPQEEQNIDFHEKISTLEFKVKQLESERLTNQLDPKVWVFITERLDSLETMANMLDLQIKAKEFKSDMDLGERWMECLAGLENKIRVKIQHLEERDKLHQKNVERIESGLIQFMEKLSKFEGEIPRIYNAEQIALMANSKEFNKKPHLCPVCYGKGKDKDKLVAEPYDQAIKVLVNPDCHSCKGRGVLWG